MLLLREFRYHRGKVIHLRTANPVTPAQLADHPDDEEATSFLRLRCELLSSRSDREKAAAAKGSWPLSLKVATGVVLVAAAAAAFVASDARRLAEAKKLGERLAAEGEDLLKALAAALKRGAP